MSFADRAKAKAKQAAGEVIGDEQMKREGLGEERAAKQDSEGRQQMTTEGMGAGAGASAMGGASEGAAGAPSESPVSNTVHNLVQTLSVKLDSAHRYGLYQEDAIREGHEDCAQVFVDIAARERETIDRLLQCLEERLGETVGGGAGTGMAAGAGSGLTHEPAPGVGATEKPPLPPEPGAGVEPVDPLAGSQGEVPPTAPGGSGADPLGPQSPPRSW
jgi:hypothetical protein